jgi:hypothetical protein
MRRPYAVLLLLPLLAACGGPDAAPPRLVSASGRGEVVAAPDRATVQLGIAARSKDLAQAQAEADQVVAQLLAVTRGLGIDDAKVRTTGIQIQPEFDWRDGRRVPLGYLVQRTAVVELTKLAKLGALMERALATGVNEVGAPQLSSSRHAELAREALALAAEDARRNAQAIATPLGADLGELVNASGEGGEQPPGPMVRSMAMERMKADVAETYSAGEVRISATVSAQFALR